MAGRRLLSGTFVVATLVVGLTSGCSSPPPSARPATSPSGTTSTASTSSAGTRLDAAFLARADAVCRPYAQYNAAHPFPYPTFDPTDPDVALLPRIGAFFDRNPANHTFVRDLKALGAPASGGTAWGRLLADLATEQDLAQQQIRLARASDAAGFVANARQVREQNGTVGSEIAAAGFASDSPCTNVG